MRCPFCHTPDSRVVDSRGISQGDIIRRRRVCGKCSQRFTTYERMERGELRVVKRNGRRQEFDPSKLREKLRIALTKRPVSEHEIDRIVSTVEGEIHALGMIEVPSTVIGEIVLRELKKLDEVAYIRFASVYRQFADVDDLRRELDDLASGARRGHQPAPRSSQKT